MIIKALLVGALLGFGLLVLRERVPGQHQIVRRGAMVLAAGGGVVAVLWPDLTTVVANLVGVDRGTDLLLYALVIVFVYSTVATAQRMHQLERSITLLTRELAIRHAHSSTQPVEVAEDATA